MKVTEALKALMLLRFIPKKDQTGDSATQEILWMIMKKAPDIYFVQTTRLNRCFHEQKIVKRNGDKAIEHALQAKLSLKNRYEKGETSTSGYTRVGFQQFQGRGSWNTGFRGRGGRNTIRGGRGQ